jgi:hypothetical protein
MSQPLHVYLTQEDRSQLTELIKSGSCSARVQNRARILLLADRSEQGDSRPRTRQQISEATMTCLPTVIRICRLYVTQGRKAALQERPRPGKAPKLTGEAEAHLVAFACSAPPEGATRWTLKLLREKLIADGHVESISQVALHQRLKKTHSSRGG